MTYYAIKSSVNDGYYDCHDDSWNVLPALYISQISAEKDVLGNVLTNCHVVEVRCDITPIKRWVPHSMYQLLCRKEYQCDGIRTTTLHARLSAGTLRVSGDGWEVLE